jgi:hypothetical protein
MFQSKPLPSTNPLLLWCSWLSFLLSYPRLPFGIHLALLTVYTFPPHHAVWSFTSSSLSHEISQTSPNVCLGLSPPYRMVEYNMFWHYPDPTYCSML